MVKGCWAQLAIYARQELGKPCKGAFSGPCTEMDMRPKGYLGA